MTNQEIVDRYFGKNGHYFYVSSYKGGELHNVTNITINHSFFISESVFENFLEAIDNIELDVSELQNMEKDELYDHLEEVSNFIEKHYKNKEKIYAGDSRTRKEFFVSEDNSLKNLIGLGRFFISECYLYSYLESETKDSISSELVSLLCKFTQNLYKGTPEYSNLFMKLLKEEWEIETL